MAHFRNSDKFAFAAQFEAEKIALKVAKVEVNNSNGQLETVSRNLPEHALAASNAYLQEQKINLDRDFRSLEENFRSLYQWLSQRIPEENGNRSRLLGNLGEASAVPCSDALVGLGHMISSTNASPGESRNSFLSIIGSQQFEDKQFFEGISRALQKAKGEKAGT